MLAKIIKFWIFFFLLHRKLEFKIAIVSTILSLKSEVLCSQIDTVYMIEILAAVNVKNVVFWDVTLYNMVDGDFV
jgi:hypothetical protein